MERTALLCKMIYLPPFVIHGTHKISAEDLEEASKNYALILENLLEGSFDASEILRHDYLNDWWLTKSKS